MRTSIQTVVLLALFAASVAHSWAQNCGLSRVDHRVNYDASGIWNPNVYRGVVGALTVAQIGGAVWEGAETRFGKTLWQGMDSEIISATTATVGKYAFTRVRPSTENNPCLWFKGGSNYSFPSGEGHHTRHRIGKLPISQERKKEYFIWAKQVVANLRGTNQTLEDILDNIFETELKDQN